MGMLENVKTKAQGLIGGNRDKIEAGLDKAGQFADSKTGGKHADKIDKGLGKVKEGLDKVAPQSAADESTQAAPPNPVAPHPTAATPQPPVTPAAPQSGAPDISPGDKP